MSKPVRTPELLDRMGREVIALDSSSSDEARRARTIARMQRLHASLLEKRRRARRRRHAALAAIATIVPAIALAAHEIWHPAGNVPLSRVTSALVEHGRTLPIAMTVSTPEKPATREAQQKSERTESSAHVALMATHKKVLAPPAHGQADKLSMTSTLAAENQLLAQALLARRQHRDEIALQLLDELRGKYPRGVLAQEAQVQHFRALARLGRASAARQAARDYLARYPNGFAAGEALQLVHGSSGRP